MEEQEELQRIREAAIERLKQQNLSGPGGLPPINLIENEMNKIRQEEQQAGADLGEERYNAMAEQETKNAQLKRLGMLGQMQPNLSQRAFDLFPNLRDITGESPSTFVGQDQQTQEEQVESEIQTPEKETSQIETSPAPSKPQSPVAEAQKVEQQQMQAQPSKEDDIESLMKQVDERERKAKMDLAVAKFRDAIIGAGGRGYKSDLSQYEEAVKGAKKPLQDYQTRLQLMEVKEQLADKKAKNDPNSAVSKMLRQSLQDIGVNMAGFENVSFNQLEKIYPSLANAISTKIAADARKIEAVAKREEAAQNKIDKLEQKQKDNLIKHIDYSINNLKKSYEQYSKSQTTIDSISNILEAAKNKITPGTSDVTLLYSFISSLDPASTVREGEITLSKSAMSLWGRIKQGSAQLTGGDLLDSATRKSIEEIMRAVQSAREKQFAKQKANMIQSGVGKGLDKDMLNAYIYPEIDASSALSTSKKEEVSIEDKLKQFEERLNKNQTRIQELKKKREM